MLDFRKSFLALATLAIGAGSAFGQVQQPLTCTAQSAGTPSIRAEGVTELVGDVLIQCNGGTPAGANENLRQVNFQIFTQPSINITSRLLAGAGTGNFSEALLFIDEPAPALQTICGSAAYSYSVPVGSNQTLISGNCGAHSGTGTGIGTYNPNVAANTVIIRDPVTNAVLLQGATQRGNAYQARQISNNSLIWQGIPFDPPGTLTSRVIRLTNVRVNATQLGVPAGSQAAVQLFISTSASGVSNPIAVPITNPTPTVASATPSLTFTVADAQTCLQCESANKTFAGDATAALAAKGSACDGVLNVVRFEESSFPTAFHRRNDARPTSFNPPVPTRQDTLGIIYQTESGFMKDTSNGDRWPLVAANNSSVAGNSGGSLGLADHGTRLTARFVNLQNGIQLWVEATTRISSNQGGSGVPTTLTTGFARLAVTDQFGGGPFQAATTGSSQLGGIAQVSIVGGAGQATWEVIETDTTAFERMEARVVVAYISNTTANLPSLGSASVSGSYAPVSQVPTASTSAPIPRFVVGATSANRTFLTINSCRTNILFPFVSNQGGFDTGLAIANTSKDPFGTALQTGACTVNFYGVVGTSKVCLSYPSPSITGGEHFVWSLSTGGQVQATAGFQGYVIAQCQFQYGHGFAFISDIGAQRLAMGYLALIMDDSIGSRTGSRSETLGH